MCSRPPEAVRADTLRAFARLGWPARVEENGAIAAVWTSRVFRFRDDVVVEVSPENGGSRVRVRSASRVGRHDFGQNARHVRELLAELEAERGGS
jgi:uncharacterized protein (DUF1499 family)